MALQSAVTAGGKKRPLAVRFTMLIGDLVLLNLAFHLAFIVRFLSPIFAAPEFLGGAPRTIYFPFEICLTAAWIGVALVTGFYKRETPSSPEQATGVFRMMALLTMAGLLYIVSQGGYNFYSRLFLMYFFLLSTTLLLLYRLILRMAMHGIPSPEDRREVLIIGAGRIGEKFFQTVSGNPSYGYHVIGFLDDNGITSRVRPMILGKLGELSSVTATRPVDEVVIALPKASEETIAELVTACEDQCIRVSVIPNDYAAYEGKRMIEEVGDFSLVRMREAPLDEIVNKRAKRIFDIIFSSMILLTVFPIVYLISAIAIKLTSKGPVIFKQLRNGEDGKPFVCYKFRTMRVLDQSVADSMQAVPDDPRLTLVGRILRRTNFDELPQFWNVLKGDMSVVGPRPHMLKHTEDYRKIIGSYMVRHFVKPGVTGWAQINGFRGATETSEKMERRVHYDVYYIEHWSFSFDLEIIGKTIVKMFTGDKNAY